ncbi:hemolysin family protein [Accumulibacter sp.]|uniref:hemolysin family protein n=1 Tax=Accumulibacter sp. TaxID=2053492 RepID=UPI0025F188E7|nr:hemolysin family protein [Accumulibacter sp.]MCM8611275.1 hemolysin family protein [Accumulibacter sp.]MCM8635312.1 hemolysin family protein [Accumulibacter sp.]MCM8638757.1 hemolysin family protein [Accumulibacter sp.]
MDPALWIELIVFVVLLGFSGFFSSTETSLFSLSQFQLDQMRAAKNPRIELIERLRSEPRRLIVTILIGNEFVNVSASVISAAMIIHLFGAENEMINLLVMVPILLLFGEITPKVLAIRNNVAFANAECRPIALFARLITPLREVIRHIADFFITLIVGKQRSEGNLVTEDMIRTLVHDAVGEGALDSQEAQYIEKIFDFGNKSLSDIMRPRSDIQFLAADLPVSELLAQIRATRQSRYPVFKGHRDTILGILHTRDLLGVDLARLERDPQGLRKLLRQPHFFPESKPAVELFHTFRQRKLSFALIVDEYGGVTGLVTMEDLLECVFGEIASPSDSDVVPRHLMSDLADGRRLIDTSMPLDDFSQEFGVRIESEEVETLAGALLQAFGELPASGATIELCGLRFTVEDLEHNRITRVLVERLPVPSAPAVADAADPAAGSETSPAAAAVDAAAASNEAKSDNKGEGA